VEDKRITYWPGADGDPSPGDIRKEFPGWNPSIGTDGLYYATRTVQVRGENPTDLRDQLIRWKRKLES
jgi:hypothetical protein